MNKIVAGLVSRSNRGGSEYLFIEYKDFPGLHGLCGGHVEEGEAEDNALMREFKEELEVEVWPLKRIHKMKADTSDASIVIWECEIKAISSHFKEKKLLM